MNDDILDSTLDDLADLPSNAAFPAGAHNATMFMSLPVPKAGKKQQVVAKFVYKSNIELANPTDAVPNEKDECTVFISLYKKDGDKNEFGQGQVKQLIAPMKEAGLQLATTREYIEATKQGVDVMIVTGTRDYNGTPQMTIVKIELAE